MVRTGSWRVLGDGLRDEEGRLWTGVRGEWLTAAEVDDILMSAGVAVVHGPRGGVRVLEGTAIVDYWHGMRAFCETPGRRAADAVAPDGATVAVHLWRRDREVVIGFLESC